MGSGGKRGCALKLAFLLHALGLIALVLGVATPYWSRVVDTSGNVISYSGLLVDYLPGGDWTFRDFNTFKNASTDKTILYITLSVIFAFVAIFLEFFLVESYAFAVYNASCGKRYNPDWLMIFSFLSGVTAITCLVLYEQFMGRSMADSIGVYNMDYSRGFAVISIGADFLAAFFTVCDRTAANDGKQTPDTKA